MTTAPPRLLGQFDVGQAAALRVVVTALRRAMGPASDASVTPVWRQALLVSSDGGTPPTLTISFDGGATPCPGVRYFASYTPVPGKVVEVLIRSGNPVVFGALA